MGYLLDKITEKYGLDNWQSGGPPAIGGGGSAGGIAGLLGLLGLVAGLKNSNNEGGINKKPSKPLGGTLPGTEENTPGTEENTPGTEVVPVPTPGTLPGTEVVPVPTPGTLPGTEVVPVPTPGTVPGTEEEVTPAPTPGTVPGTEEEVTPAPTPGTVTDTGIQDKTNENIEYTIQSMDFNDVWQIMQEERQKIWDREDAIRKETQAREDNAWQRAIADARKAGINPNLMNMQPAESGGGITQGSGLNYSMWQSEVERQVGLLEIALNNEFKEDENTKDRIADLIGNVIKAFMTYQAFK